MLPARHMIVLPYSRARLLATCRTNLETMSKPASTSIACHTITPRSNEPNIFLISRRTKSSVLKMNCGTRQSGHAHRAAFAPRVRRLSRCLPTCSKLRACGSGPPKASASSHLRHFVRSWTRRLVTCWIWYGRCQIAQLDSHAHFCRDADGHALHAHRHGISAARTHSMLTSKCKRRTAWQRLVTADETALLTVRRMSALGQKQTYAVHKAMSALHPIATAKADFRKTSCLLYPRKRTCTVH